MKKKVYQKPTIKVCQIQVMKLIAGSDGGSGGGSGGGGGGGGAAGARRFRSSWNENDEE